MLQCDTMTKILLLVCMFGDSCYPTYLLARLFDLEYVYNIHHIGCELNKSCSVIEKSTMW